MALALLEQDVTFAGPALPEPYVKLKLEEKLLKLKLLPKDTGAEGKKLLDEEWQPYCRRLREMGEHGGAQRVRNQVVEPLVKRLGWDELVQADEVVTREGPEVGGYLLRKGDAHLRVFVVAIGTDLDAPSQRGQAYRFSPSRVAERVLLAQKERIGILTDGLELRLVLPDPAGRDSHIAIAMRGPSWRSWREVPDSFRLLLALASPRGVAAIPELIEEARLAQTGVTKKLRDQAKNAILRFVQEVLDHPANRDALAGKDRDALARKLWRESLILVYRVLFILKLESDPDPARAFRFTANRLWKDTYSPSLALADLVRGLLDKGEDTGHFLEQGLRTLFRMFAEGVRSNEMPIAALGGALFGEASTPTLVRELKWGERAVANLLDCLLWTPGERGTERERVHYGSLDVEDLGRVYEALLELEPGIADEPMCRLRRAKLEVVVPVAQGEPYRDAKADGDDADEDEEPDEDDEDEKPKKGRGQKTKVQWIEEIPAGRFYVRVGLGRKASGSYYTPHPFVRFLVEETLGPQIKERSPQDDPRPADILKLKVLDPAMGSGHFLVEACRYLGAALYEACRLCDERALEAERKAETVGGAEKATLLARAAQLRQRVQDLPDPNDELLEYLPSRTPEGGDSGLAQRKAAALCRRLVTVHCLYGVDKNELAVELAKVALWLESYAEGLPLTFLDHRLVCGDSLTGPMLDQLKSRPVSGEPVQDIFRQGLERKMPERIQEALAHVRELEASVGKDLADLELKRAAKAKLDDALAPIRTLAEAWSGAAMLGEPACDDAFAALAASTVDLAAKVPAPLEAHIARMTALGRDSVPYDLVFPEVFHADGSATRSGGFDAVIGNPPWDKIKLEPKGFVAAFDFSVFDSDRKSEWGPRVEHVLHANPTAAASWDRHVATAHAYRAASRRLVRGHEGAVTPAGDTDLFQLFVMTAFAAAAPGGCVGLVLGGGFLKNPSAARSRELAMVSNSLLVLNHYHNRQGLFADLPPIVEFGLFASRLRAPHAPNKSRIALDQTAFPGYGDPWQEVPAHELVARFGPLLIPFARRSGATTSPDLGEQENVEAALMRLGLTFATDIHRTQDEESFRLVADILEDGGTDGRTPDAIDALWVAGFAPVRNGRSVWQYDDMPAPRASRWQTDARFAFPLADEPQLAHRARYFRVAFRETCGSPKTNERSMVAVLLPPGNVCVHKLFVEAAPWARPHESALAAVAVLNSFVLDSLLRPSIQTSISKALLRSVRWPAQERYARAAAFLSEASLELHPAHRGYEPLRRAVGLPPREPPAAGARVRLRQAVEAVVADAFGLDADAYASALTGFRESAFDGGRVGYLAAFDELRRVGIDAFVQQTLPRRLTLATGPAAAILQPTAAFHSPAAPAEQKGPRNAEKPAVAAAPSDGAPAWMKRTPTDRALLIACRAADLHAKKGTGELTNVKLEKLLHLVEAHCGIDLERAPIREAAGPADFPRLKKLAHRATMTGVLDVEEGGPGRGAVWRQGRNARLQLDEFGTIFGEKAADIDRVLGLFVPPMGPDEAEIVATLYAAWNDLVAGGAAAGDDAVVEEFYRWAPGKRQFPRERLVKALGWMRDKNLIPTGQAKRSVARANEQFGLLGDVPAAAPKKKPRKGR